MKLGGHPPIQHVTHADPDLRPQPPSMDYYNAMRADRDFIEIVSRGHFMSRKTFMRYGFLFEPYAGEREAQDIAREEKARERGREGNRIGQQRRRDRERAALAEAGQV